MKKAYAEGREARAASAGKNANPWPHMTEAWSWWMAGWNDRDMDLS